MIDPDFLRLVTRLGAIELELRALEAGGIPSRAPPIALSETEITMRVAFLANVGARVLRQHEPEVQP